ncbi:Maf family protein [Zhongshania aliphaticivorans]|uniref:Maf family protein n=1 Tax=Zhongshania aliphaticivorans TaxID=1470434 RepID=UPI00190F4840|nr:nucleoside triphosphate pyrophosphatase [Zhongshania aliphaticivorans]
MSRNNMIVLASGSPRRAELLLQIGVEFQIVPADIDETPKPNELAVDYVQRMAAEKAVTVARLFPDRVVLAADTSVIVDGEIWGKPLDRQHAKVMLAGLSGRSHQVMTALAVFCGGGVALELNVTEVEFAVLTPEQIDTYIASGDADDKAGAYGIQGVAGCFVKHLSGSYSGVMGLPLYETAVLLGKAGIILEPANE